MALKATYLELASAGPGLRKLMAIDKTACPSPVDRARIARFTKPIIKELAEYDRLRNELIAECGTPIEGKPGQFQIQPDKAAKFRDETIKLNAIEVEIAVTPLPVSLWKLADLTVDEMNGLGQLIEWPPEDAVEEPVPAPAPPKLAPVK